MLLDQYINKKRKKVKVGNQNLYILPFNSKKSKPLDM